MAFDRSVDEEIKGLRYQLPDGIAGTIIEARNSGASIASFAGHKFRSREPLP